MPDEFDPYLAWLGILTTSRPPTHYQLLGLADFEHDAARISAAADARMGEVRKYQTGPRGKFTQKLLNELSSARVCLLDARAKAAYDASLRPQAVAVVYVPIESPPRAEPPAAPPPLPLLPPPAAPQHAERAVDEDASPKVPLSPWWGLLGLFFVVIMIGSGLTVYVVSLSRARESENPPDFVSASPAVPPAAPIEEEVLVIAQEGNGDLSFPASTAELSEQLQRAEVGGESVINGWKDDTTVARWRFKTVRPAVFQVRLSYLAKGATGARWQLKINDELKSRDLHDGESIDAIVTDEFFWRVSHSGEQVFELSVDGLTDDSAVTLKSVRFLYQPGGRIQ